MSAQEDQKHIQNRCSLPASNCNQREEAADRVRMEFEIQEQGRRGGDKDSTAEVNAICADCHYNGYAYDEEKTTQIDEGFRRTTSFPRNFSMSEDSANSSESSPLLNPLKPIPNRTQNTTLMHRTWQWYETNLDRRPLVTKAMTSALVTLVADFVGQCIEQYHADTNANGIGGLKHLDLDRLVRFSTMGMFLQAPATHYYYLALDYYLPPTPLPWTHTTFFKLAIDQTIYGPSYLFLVIVYLAIIEGSSWHNIQEQLQDNYWTTLFNSWFVWIPASVVNMAYVPPAFRVLYCNVVSGGWSIYLSLALNHSRK